MHAEVGILRIYDDDFSSGLRRYEQFKHWFLFKLVLLKSPYNNHRRDASLFYNAQFVKSISLTFLTYHGIKYELSVTSHASAYRQMMIHHISEVTLA